MLPDWGGDCAELPCFPRPTGRGRRAKRPPIRMRTHDFTHVDKQDEWAAPVAAAGETKVRLISWGILRACTLDSAPSSRRWLLTDFNYDPQELIWLLAVYPFLLPSTEANYARVAVDERWTPLMALRFSLCIHITEGYGLWNEITSDYCAVRDCAIKHYGPEQREQCESGPSGRLLVCYFNTLSFHFLPSFSFFFFPPPSASRVPVSPVPPAPLRLLRSCLPRPCAPPGSPPSRSSSQFLSPHITFYFTPLLSASRVSPCGYQHGQAGHEPSRAPLSLPDHLSQIDVPYKNPLCPL